MTCDSKFIIPASPDQPVEILERGPDLYCPVCSTHIEAEGVGPGDKCRCMDCGAKFLIPQDNTSPFEILERGKSSVQKDAPRMKVASAPVIPSSSNAAAATESVEQAATKPSTRAGNLKVPAAGGASMRTVVVHAPQKKSGGAMIWVMLILCGAGVFGYMKFMGGDDTGTENPGVESKVVKRVTIPSRPVAPVQPVVPEEEEFDDSTPFDTSLADLGTFEMTEKKKQRGLDFLKSGKLATREAAYTAFRSLGEEYHETYAELLGKARVHHLALLGKKADSLSSGPQAPPDFENAHSAWKVAADAALEMIRTNWRRLRTDSKQNSRKWREHWIRQENFIKP